jgi:hypothetical protein
MRRTALKPGKGFQRKTLAPRVCKQVDHTPPRASNLRMADARSFMRIPVEVPKDEPLQHAGYMNLVRAMACIRCKHPPRSQFCHSDEGKGTAIKSDCRLGWPGCADCHFVVGTARIYTKQKRRELEAMFAKKTRDAIRAAGLWPKRLPLWKEDQ